MRVLVVGGGIVGLCTAWACRRAGHEVVLFEQGPLPNALGSSGDETRLIRFPYGALAGYGRLIPAAYAAWTALWGDLGTSYYRETGTVAFGYTDGDWADLSRRQLAEDGIQYRLLAPTEVERALPHVRADGIAWALSSPTGGVLFASRIVAALAAHLGPVVRAHTAVDAVDLLRGEVAAGAELLRADRVVVAAGPWTARLVPELAASLTPSRQVVVYSEAPKRYAADWQRSPMLLDIDPERGFYAVPPVQGIHLKIADHRFTLRGDPDGDRAPAPGEAAALLALCGRRLRDAAEYVPVFARTCFYTVTADERFRVDWHDRGVVVSPCSGHGFKFGALLGDLIAQALDGRRGPEEVSRIAAGQPA
jgi:glycine/D-amino acid oxidase-like deaminating enzyme